VSSKVRRTGIHRRLVL